MDFRSRGRSVYTEEESCVPPFDIVYGFASLSPAPLESLGEEMRDGDRLDKRFDEREIRCAFVLVK